MLCTAWGYDPDHGASRASRSRRFATLAIDLAHVLLHRIGSWFQYCKPIDEVRHVEADADPVDSSLRNTCRWLKALSFLCTYLLSSSSSSCFGSWALMVSQKDLDVKLRRLLTCKQLQPSRSSPTSSKCTKSGMRRTWLIEHSDGGGWGTGLSCLVGLATPVWCFIGPVSKAVFQGRM